MVNQHKKFKMHLPKECKMSKLSDLYRLKPKLTVAVLVFEGKHLTEKEHLYLRLFVRLIDKAIYEYSIARDAIIAETKELQGKLKKKPCYLRPIFIGNRPMFMFDFADHMETCLNTIRRLYGLRDVIWSESSGLKKMDNSKRRFVKAHFKKLNEPRGVIQHMDEKIREGIFKGPIAPTISENDEEVEISDKSIRFTDIEGVLRRFHEIANIWIDEFNKNEKSP